MLVWRNKGLDNRVGREVFFLNYFFFKYVYCIYCSKCLWSCTIEWNKTKKLQHNFIPLSCALFQCFITLISQSLVYFSVKLSTKTPCCSKKNHQTTPWRFLKKVHSDQILGSGRLRQTNFFYSLFQRIYLPVLRHHVL